jgi:hypothetical protein
MREDFSRRHFKVGNGLGTRIWEDTWLGDEPLASQHPMLYNIANRKTILVAYVLSHNPLNIEFRRALTRNKWAMWLHLVQRLMDIHL